MPSDGADRAGHDDGHEADDDGDARAEDEPREHVAAEVIGAEEVLGGAARSATPAAGSGRPARRPRDRAAR